MHPAAALRAPAEVLVQLAMRLLASLQQEEARTLKAAVPAEELSVALRLTAMLRAAQELRHSAVLGRAGLLGVLGWLGFASGAQAGAPVKAAAPEQVQVAVSSFAAPLFQGEHAGLKVSPANADEAATEVGRSSAELGTSDLPLSEADRVHAPGLAQFPVAAGAVVVVVNLPEVPGLRLTPAALTAIFLGRAQTWDDKRIAGCNPDVELPARRIVVARRSDRNGASAAIMGLIAGEAPWLRVKATPQATFPAALALRGDDALAEAIARVPDSIGYVELSRAAAHGLRPVPLLLASGAELLPTSESVRLALEEPSAPGAWPLTVRISAFVDTARSEPERPLLALARAESLLQDPQAIAAAGLFPLPASIATLVRDRLHDHADALRAFPTAPPAVALR